MKTHLVLFAALAAVSLAACDGSSTDGIEVHVKALAVDAPHAESHAVAGAVAKSGDSHIKTFRRSDGLRIDLQLGLVNLKPIELLACTPSLAQGLRRLNPLATAYAHGDVADDAPIGPVNVTAAAGSEYFLASLPAAPGPYCGMRVVLQPGVAAIAKHGGALDADMTGSLSNVAPCYYAGTEALSDEDAAAATAHKCIQAKVLRAARPFDLAFPAPVELSRAHRDLELTLLVHYKSWFDGLDMALLSADAAQQDALVENIVESVQAQIGDAALSK